MAAESEPVSIGRFIDVRQAEMARSILEANGIDSFLDQPFTGSIAPHYMLGSGGIRLFVSTDDQERALEILAAFEAESAPGSEMSDDDGAAGDSER
jgi:hypothetical protein